MDYMEDLMTQNEYQKTCSEISNRNRNNFMKYIYAMLEIEGCDISDIKRIDFNEKTCETKITYYE